MAAIVTDQFRIFNVNNFIDSVENTSNSYYVFLGLPNPTVGFGRTSSWDTNTPNPIDSIDYLSHYGSTILFGKKIKRYEKNRHHRTKQINVQPTTL